jgi:hypothetical protein
MKVTSNVKAGLEVNVSVKSTTTVTAASTVDVSVKV